ncbi:MAG TPA: MauE/DoxX family redox-associated membrane protein [Actinomycetota bacterium]|nr:MauE/DoxX family redox-associated membrane protein [Actinomycetota bacterium]
MVTLVFLLVFTGAIVKAVRNKMPVPCGCFGRLDHEPVGARTVLRNVLLISLALLIALLPAKYQVMSVDALLDGVRTPSIGDVLPLLLTE